MPEVPDTVDDAIEPLSSPSTDDVFEATRPFSAREIASAAASEALSGGAVAPNWCVLSVTPPASPLTDASPLYTFLEADLAIAGQAGTDFSVGTFGGKGAVFSAAGGLFQMGGLLTAPNNGTLDGGSTLDRFVEVQAAGGIDDFLSNLGYDFCLPVNKGNPTFTVASLPLIVEPGGPALWPLKARLLNHTGTDSVPLSSIFGTSMFSIWQIA